MLRLFFVLTFSLIFAASAFADGPVTLRERIEAHGPAVTLGDVFDNAGPAAARALTLSPPPGRSANLSVRFLAAAAAAAGLDWTPPEGLAQVAVTRASAPLASNSAHRTAAFEASVRRGDFITLAYSAPGVEMQTRARALEDGAVGQAIRVINPQSNRQLDVVVIGAGAATANRTP